MVSELEMQLETPDWSQNELTQVGGTEHETSSSGIMKRNLSDFQGWRGILLASL